MTRLFPGKHGDLKYQLTKNDSHVEEISKNTRIDIAKVQKIRYLHDFDRLVHSNLLHSQLMSFREVQGPTWGYPTEGAYYRDASCCDSLLAVRTPLFAIHAEDDPVY